MIGFEHLAPIGYGTHDREPRAEWFARFSAELPRFPRYVAEHWLYENWAGTPFPYLPLARMTFELHMWSLHEAARIEHGPDWTRGGYVDGLTWLDNVKPSAADPGLPDLMRRDGTWPVPIIVLDNESRATSELGEQLPRWCVIEGHLRLRYFRCLVARGWAHPQHELWLMRIDASTA